MYKRITGGSKASQGKANKRDAAALDQAKVALLRLKFLMGARMYMRSPQVHAIFKIQKERIGEVLGKLDTGLPKNPRVSDLETKKYAPWEKQGLKALWDEYMNDRFKKATTRLNNDMETYLELLEKHWGVPKSQGATPPAKPGPKPPAKPGPKPTTPNPDSLADQMAGLNINDPKVSDFSNLIKKLQDKWNEEKRSPWKAPWL